MANGSCPTVAFSSILPQPERQLWQVQTCLRPLPLNTGLESIAGDDQTVIYCALPAWTGDNGHQPSDHPGGLGRNLGEALEPCWNQFPCTLVSQGQPCLSCCPWMQQSLMQVVNLHGYLACIYNHLGDTAPGMAGRRLPERLNCRGNMAMNLKQSQVGYMGEFEGKKDKK